MNKWFRRSSWVVLSGFLALLVLAGFGRFLVQAGPSLLPSSPPMSHIAIMGKSADIAGVAQPFVDSGDLHLLRHYPNPVAFLQEAPTNYFPGGYPADLAVQLFEVTTYTWRASTVVSEVMSDASAVGLATEVSHLGWLTYMPAQVMVSGDCGAVDAVVRDLPPNTTLNRQDRTLLYLSPYVNTCEEIHLYTIMSAERVVSMTTQLNAIAANMGVDVYAEPNHLAMATQEYIAGSPGGPQIPDGPPLLMTSPLTPTGAGVRVVAFDTIPYNLDPSQQISITTLIDGVPVTVWAPFYLPVDLPLGEDPVPAHGTFVASPITKLAPDTDIHLVRVLNAYGIGDTYSVYTATHMIIQDSLPRSRAANGLVFNYSFVLESPFTSNNRSATIRLIEFVNKLKIVQVGAAGNDSAYTVIPQSMPLPAVHPLVIGVTAATDDGRLSCYANRGDVAAPGGGIPRGTLCDTQKIVMDCAAGINPDVCKTGWDPFSVPRPFDWGLGTSFAAPVVSGLVAQIVELLAPGATNHPLAHSNSLLPPETWPDPAEVQEALYALANTVCDPALGVGVLLAPPGNYNCQTYLPIVLR